ncbi:transporter substrate-binding domain-containing protein [Pseudoalteromonas sp. JBTF-M23]|uniref:Transporter substrate-binding domain-containing protein n=1 Tax=Pseudoalteromonas caenipelagi TaxID=2726988 RepID=A0A849VEV6_9GAMM|nr:transporter substrate-binding domain-containing protein [Pseudoalteromonas caenipelagi]NOU50464.1 transporter substrate-binding domain-containing protein [Pseudoalteromonas caenipelagi]
MRCKLTIVALLYASSLLASNAQARIINLVTLEYPPYEFQGAQDASGIAVEIVQEAFSRIDQPINIVFMPWGRAIREVKAGRVDGIFTIYKTPERETFMDYSQEILIEQSISFFALKSQPIYFSGRIASLSPYRIGIVRKVSYGEEIDNAIQSGTLENLVTTDTGINSFKLLLADRVDVVISNQLGGFEILKRLGIEGKVQPIPSYSYEIPSYIAFSKNKKLESIKKRVEVALRDMKEDGTYQKIVDEYLKHYREHQPKPFNSPELGADMVGNEFQATQPLFVRGTRE